MADEPITPRNIKEPSYADAIIPAITLIVLIAGAVFLFGLDAVDGPMQVALIISAVVVALIILENGHAWDEIAKSAQTALASVTTRYAAWNTPRGRAMLSGELSLDAIAVQAQAEELNPSPRSGRQERLENLVSRYF